MQESDQHDHLTSLPPLPPQRTTAKIFVPMILSIAAVLIAIASIGTQFLLWQQQLKIQDKLFNQSQRLQAAFQPQIQQFTVELARLKQEFAEQKQVMGNVLAKEQEDAKKSSILKAEEAQELLTLAQYNLLFAHDISLATKLLIAADQKLQETNDPGLAQIRKLLNENLAALAAVPQVDITSIITTISSLSDQVTRLTNLPVLPAPSSVKPSLTNNLTWQQKLLATFQSLKGIISIRRLPEELKPLPSTEQHIYLVENIRLQLSQAEWAVLHQNPILYQKSLQDAKKQIETYYAQNKDAANLISRISSLMNINIKPPVPDLSNVITALHNYLENAAVTSSHQPPPNPPTSLGTPNPSPAQQTPNSNAAQSPGVTKQPQVSTTPIPRVLPS